MEQPNTNFTLRNEASALHASTALESMMYAAMMKAVDRLSEFCQTVESALRSIPLGIMKSFCDLSSVVSLPCLGCDDNVDWSKTKAVLAMVIFAMSVLGLGVIIMIKRKNKLNCSDGSAKRSLCDLAKTASEPCHTDFVKDLVTKQTIDVNRPLSKCGLSLFMCACLSGERRLIQFLLSRGADIHQRNIHGDTPLYLATFGALTKKATAEDRDKVLEDFIRAGCDVNSQNNKGYTALHRAASKGDIKIIKCLLNNGARADLTSATGIYPIDLAINAGHTKAAELLAIDLDEPFMYNEAILHTPSRARLGLLSPAKKHLVESTLPRRCISRITGAMDHCQ